MVILIKARESSCGIGAEMMWTFARWLVNAILGKVDRLDTTTRMAMDANFSERKEPLTPKCEAFRKVDQIEELRRILGELRSAR